MLDGSYAQELSEKFGVEANQKAIRDEAVKKIASLAVVYGTSAMTIEKTMEFLGTTREKNRALRETVLPEYAEKRPLFITSDPKTGDVRWMNTSYLIPQQQFVGPFMAGFNGRSFGEGLKYGVEGISEDILGEGSFTMNALTQALNNYDFERDRKITTAEDPSTKMLDKGKFFVGELLTPGFVNEVEKSKTRPVSQTAQRLIGLRFNDTTIDKGFGFRARSLNDNLNTERSNIARARFRVEDGKMNQQEFDEVYNQSNQSYRDNLQSLNRHVSNLRTIGLDEGKIAGMLTDNGFGSEITLAALDGEVIDAPKIKRDTITDLYDEIAMLPRKEREARIRNTSKEDPELGKKLASRHKQQVIDEVRNVNNKDMVIRRLGIDDGTRARYIWKQMQKNQEPDSVLKMFMKKGIATPEVVRDIRILQKK
jgi:hypothetical protein